MLSRFDREIRPVMNQHAAALAGTLHDGMAHALSTARRNTVGLPHEEFPHLIPMHLRCSLRVDLRERALPGGWVVSGDSTKMGQLLLANDDLGVDLRFLKERRRTYPGGVPVAGPNKARRYAWGAFANYDSPLIGLDVSVDEPRERATILWLWDFDGPADLADSGFVQRLVHPIAPGVYGRAVPCDLSIDLMAGGQIYDRLKFAGDEEDTDFFNFELAETAEDEV